MCQADDMAKPEPLILGPLIGSDSLTTDEARQPSRPLLPAEGNELALMGQSPRQRHLVGGTEVRAGAWARRTPGVTRLWWTVRSAVGADAGVLGARARPGGRGWRGPDAAARRRRADLRVGPAASANRCCRRRDLLPERGRVQCGRRHRTQRIRRTADAEAACPPARPHATAENRSGARAAASFASLASFPAVFAI